MIRRIHVLEDDSDIRDVIEYLLKDEGYELQLSSSFSELKSKLRDSLPDLFLVDVMLPDGNGIEICADLKNDIFTKHIPVIVMSANPRSKQLSSQAFADDYISKPFDVDDVVKRIDQLLDNKGTQTKSGSTSNQVVN
jgi:two-component system phosphate regulon response regulator PhoB